jgi:ribonucleoside-diphosphate reductase alpha chain
MDNKLTSDPDDIFVAVRIESLKKTAREENKKWAELLGIPPSAAITCVKPSGTVSQLCNTSSGIHPRYSEYYIRTVRADAKDPMTQFMMEKGFPWELDVMNKNNIIFSFPIKSPKAEFYAGTMSAMDQLKLWKIYQDYWCEHKPSCTVYYRDSEFLQIGQWVWDNFDDISGISFLPYSDHIYEQAPYQPISEEKYLELSSKFPTVEWSEFYDYEKEDGTNSAQDLACAGGVCEVVDITKK